MKNSISVLLIILLFSAIFYLKLPGTIAGDILPVIRDFEISKLEAVSDGIYIYGSFEKIRDCNFMGVEVYLHEENRFSKIEVEFLDSRIVRKPGSQVFGPWSLAIDSEQFINIDMYAMHECHVFWITKTRMLP